MGRTRLSSGFIGRLLIMALAAALAGVILGATAFAQEYAAQDQYAEPATPESTTEPTTPDPLASSQSLESVDWWNTRYTTDCQGLAAQPFTVDVHNGEGHGPPDSTYGNGYIIRVEAVATGDLTGDGRPETAVLLYCSPQPSNFFVQDVLVFTDDTDGPQLLAQLPKLSPLPDGLDLPPVFDPEQFFIRSGQLVTGVDYYSATDSHASGPSIHRVFIWQWDGSRFVPTEGDTQDDIDLEVTDLKALAQPVCAGSNVTFRAFIRNNGSRESGFFNIRWIADNTQTFDGGHFSIPAGAADTHDHIWKDLSAGEHRLEFIADFDNQIPEPDENNNLSTLNFTAEDCSNKPGSGENNPLGTGGDGKRSLGQNPDGDNPPRNQTGGNIQFFCLGGSSCNGVQNPRSPENPGLSPSTVLNIWRSLIPGLIQATIDFKKTVDQTVPREVMCGVELYTGAGGKVEKLAGLNPDHLSDISGKVGLLQSIWYMNPIDLIIGLSPGSSCIELIVDRLAPGQREALNQCLERYDTLTCLGLRSSPVMRNGTPVP